jgi:thioredoxin 2
MLIFRCPRCGRINRVPDDKIRARPRCGGCKEPLDLSGAPQPVSGPELWRAVEQSPVPVLVDAWAVWCGPCRMAAPIFEELGRARAGRLLVLKLDTDADEEAARRLAISSIPTFILFVGGREAARRSGVASRADLEGWISGAASGQGATTWTGSS